MDKKEYLRELSEEDQQVSKRVYERYRDMRDDPNRKDALARWKRGMKMFLQYIPTRSEDDWRSMIVMPDGHAAVQTYMQETIERKARPLMREVEDSDREKARFANALLSFNMDQTKFDFEAAMTRFYAAITGTGHLVEEYVLETREVRDVKKVNKDRSIEYVDRMIVDKDDTYATFYENDYIFVDPAGWHISHKADCVIRDVIKLNQVHLKYEGKPGIKNLDMVRAGKQDENELEIEGYEVPEDLEADEVEVLRYSNRETDEYIILANQVPIYEEPLPSRHKELPITPFYYSYVPGRYWGLGIPDAIYSIVEERQSLRRLNLDRQNLQLNKMFIVDRGTHINREQLRVRPHGFIEVDANGTPLNQIIVPLEYGDVPASYFRTDDMLRQDTQRAHGIDDRIQSLNVGGTATEAAILKESSLKRINYVSHMAEMDSYLRVGHLKWSNIKTYWPAGKILRITREEEGGEKIKTQPRKVSVKDRVFSLVPGDGGNELVSQEINGYSSFELNQSMSRFIEGEFDMVTEVGSSDMSKPIRQAKTTEMVNLLSGNPVLAQTLDPFKAANEYLEVNDFKAKNWLRQSFKPGEMEELAENENEIMAEGTPLAPTKDASVEHTMVHMQFTQSSRFEELPDTFKQAFESHILGEVDNNPALKSALGGLGGTTGAGSGATPFQQAPQAGPIAQQPADIQPNLG